MDMPSGPCVSRPRLGARAVVKLSIHGFINNPISYYKDDPEDIWPNPKRIFPLEPSNVFHNFHNPKPILSFFCSSLGTIIV